MLLARILMRGQLESDPGRLATPETTMLGRFKLLLLCGMLLAACGMPRAPTAQSVLDLFTAAGLEAANPHRPPFADQGLFPRTFNDGLTFELPSLGKNIVDQARNGSVLVCATKQNCDTIYDYLDTYSGLIGPYYYQSHQGTVVVFLDNKLPKATAAKYEQIVHALP